MAHKNLMDYRMDYQELQETIVTIERNQKTIRKIMIAILCLQILNVVLEVIDLTTSL